MSKNITGFQIDIGFNGPIDSSQAQAKISQLAANMIAEFYKQFDCSGHGVNFEFEEEHESDLFRHLEANELSSIGVQVSTSNNANNFKDVLGLDDE